MQSESAADKHVVLRDTVNDALKRRGCPIPEELSERYAGHLDRKNRPYLFALIMICALAYAAYALADLLAIPDMALESLLLRWSYSGAVVLLTVWLIRRIRCIYRLELLLPVFVHLSVLLWMYLMVNTEAPNTGEFAYASVIFVLVLNIGIRGRFLTALVSSMSLTVLLFVAIWLINDREPASLLLYTMIYSPLLLFSLVICWYNVFNERRLFLWSMIDEINNTELLQANKLLWQQSHTDDLTGLPNRTLLAERVERAMLSADRRQCKAALLFLDLDHFKPVNDNYGHVIGDQLLREVASRMAGSVRATDTVARYGGDEFILVLPDIGCPEEALQIAEKLIRALQQPFAVADTEVTIGCSIGVALYPDHGLTIEQLHHEADQALYQAKTQGRNRAIVVAVQAAQVR